MAFNKKRTDSDFGRPGFNNEVSENKGILSKIALVSKNTSFPDTAAAETKSNWDDIIKQSTGRCFPTPSIVEVEDLTADSTTQEFASGDTRTISPIKYVYRVTFDIADAVLAELFTLNGGSFDAYLFWQNGIIEGSCVEGETTFYPKKVNEFTVDKRSLANGTEVQTVMATFAFSNRDDFEVNTAHVWPDTGVFNPLDLDSVRGVDLTLVDATGDNGTLTVKDKVGNGVEGLVLADFDDTGSTPNLTTVTEVGGGTYTLGFDGPGAATINLVAASSISIDDYIESTGSATATITT